MSILLVSALAPAVAEESPDFASILIDPETISWRILPTAADFSRVVLRLSMPDKPTHRQAVTFFPGANLELKAINVSGVEPGDSLFEFTLAIYPRASTPDPTHPPVAPKLWQPMTGRFIVHVDDQGKPTFVQAPLLLEAH